jgi:hypothetical protein
LRAYGPPFWRDLMFWIAAGLSLLIGILIVIVLFMLLSTPRTDKGWAWTIGFFVVGTWIGFVILSLGLNTARGIDRGAKEADAARGDRFEEQGRKAGKVVGSGLAKVTGRSKTTPVSTQQEHPIANESQSSEPKPTLDDAARSLGMMVGRRLGSRKDKS